MARNVYALTKYPPTNYVIDSSGLDRPTLLHCPEARATFYQGRFYTAVGEKSPNKNKHIIFISSGLKSPNVAGFVYDITQHSYISQRLAVIDAVYCTSEYPFSFDPNQVLIFFPNGIHNTGNDTTIRPPWNPPTEPTGEPAPLFTRGISGGSCSVPEVPLGLDPSKDYIAPGRIIDLRVPETFFDEATVTLLWSAPGDDLDSGAGMYAVIVCFKNRSK